jgi:hypothetical protein
MVCKGPTCALCTLTFLNLVMGPEWVRPEQDTVLAEEALKLWTVEFTNMVNLLQILDAVKAKKASRYFVTHPTQVILSSTVSSVTMASTSSQKISLKTLFNHWSSESLGKSLCLALSLGKLFLIYLILLS